MRKFAIVALTALFATATVAPVPFVGFESTAEAAKVKKKAKDQPGKCGTGRFYDKKKKACASK